MSRLFRGVAKTSVQLKRFHDSYINSKLDAMNDQLDDNGWAHIHVSASRGYVKSIEKFVVADHEQLEVQTSDSDHLTPFLVAVTHCSLDSIQCLLGLGAKADVTDGRNRGAVEICASNQFISILEYFISLNDDRIPVWKNLLKFISNESDEDVLAGGTCLRTLTQDIGNGISINWEPLFKAGGVPVLIKVCKSSVSDESKIAILHTILNIIEKPEVKEQIISTGGISVLVKLMKCTHLLLVQLTAQIIKVLAKIPDYANQIVQGNGIPALLNILKTIKNDEVLPEAVEALGNIAEAGENHQSTIGGTTGAIPTIISLFEGCMYKPLLIALTQSVSRISKLHTQNQTTFVAEGVIGHVVVLTLAKQKELQLSSVDCIHVLSEDNTTTQNAILNAGVDRPLMQLLRKSRDEKLLEKSAAALWSMAGDDYVTQRSIANGIGVPTLIEFLNSISEALHYIGSEGISVLAQGPCTLQSDIAKANGIHPLSRHLRSDKEHIVLSVIRTLRHLCVGVGYVPHIGNQTTIQKSGDIRLLVALMVHSRNEVIQMEAALTLASVALGNQSVLDDIHKNVDFRYIRILKMLYAREPQVRLLAGSSLATFAYNNLSQQEAIDEQGGVRFTCFMPFLQSDDEVFRCNAAFQVVALARIIPDEEQANSSAVGIKLLVDLLHDSQSATAQWLAADCIARIAHTRAGIPEAIIAIDGISYLTDLLMSRSDRVQGCAAIALGYLSYIHPGERKLLNRCRLNPSLMKVLLFYTSTAKISPSFTEAWQHYKRIGLPIIPEGKVSLVSPRPDPYKAPLSALARPDTIVSAEDTANSSSNVPISESNLRPEEGGGSSGGDGDDGTGRSSRVSRASRATRMSVSSLHQVPIISVSDSSRKSSHASSSHLAEAASMGRQSAQEILSEA